MRRITLIARAAVPALAVLVLAGCGGSGPRPATALDLDGHTVSTEHVDEVSDRYCAALTKAGLEKPVAAGSVRAQVVSALAARLAAETFGAERGLQAGPSYDRDVKALRQQLTGFDAATRDAVVEVQGAQSYVSAVVGAGDGQEFTSWLGRREVVVNPVYGVRLSGESITRVDASISVATSATARAAVEAAADPSGDAVVPGGRTCG